MKSKKKIEENYDISREQIDLLTGLMLGDGCIQYSHGRSNNNNPRLTIVRQLKDEEYNFWIHSKIKYLCNSKPFRYEVLDKRTNKTYQSSRIYSKSLPYLKHWFNYWYPEGKKRVPRTIEFTPLVLLIWFLDDGSIIVKNKGLNCKLTIKMSTHGFVKEDVEFLACALSSYFKCHFRIQHENGNYYIEGSGDAAIRYIQHIDDIYPDCMSRKKTWANLNLDSLNTRGSQIIKSNVFNYAISDMLLMRNCSQITVKEIANRYNWINKEGKPHGTISSYLNMMCENNIFTKYFESEFGKGRRAIFILKDKFKLEELYNNSKTYLDGYGIDPYSYIINV